MDNLHNCPIEKFTSFFIFPFSYSADKIEPGGKWGQRLPFKIPEEKGDLVKDWSCAQNYSEYIYFHDYVRSFLFPDINQKGKGRDASNESLAFYKYDLHSSEQSVVVEMEIFDGNSDEDTKKSRTIAALVNGIYMHIYPGKIGIFVIETSNGSDNEEEKNDMPPNIISAGGDLLLFNNMFRRAYPSYFERDDFGLFRVGDIIRFDELIQKINNTSDSLSVYIKTQFSQNGRKFLNNYDPSIQLLDEQKKLLIKELNELLKDAELYDEIRFLNKDLRDKTKTLLKKNPENEDLIILNRCLLEDAYPHEVAKLKNYDIFISYSRKDRPFATEIVKLLREEGVKVWFDDREIGAGANVLNTINKGLRESRKMLAVFSWNYWDCDYAKSEIEAVINADPNFKNRLIIPVLIDDSKSKIPPTHTNPKRIDYNKEKGNFSLIIKDVIEALNFDSS